MAFANPSPSQQQLGVASSPPPPTLKQRLMSGDTSYGILLCTASPIVAEIVSLSGYDVVVIDADHSPVDAHTSVQILQALGNAGSQGIIRVPENSHLYLKRALDMGPAGIIVPTIDSADAAKKAVASCKYPPAGIRSYSSPTVRASMFGLQQEYMRRIEDCPLIIAQIESELAVGRIPEIAAVDGIDCVMVSPDDLATSLGKFPEHAQDDVLRLVRRAEEAVVNSGKLLGTFMPNTSSLSASEMFMRGYSIIIGSSDVALLRDNARNDVAKVKGVVPRSNPGAFLSDKGGPQNQHPMMVARVPVGPGGIPGLPQITALQGGLSNPLAQGAVLLSGHTSIPGMGGGQGMQLQFNVSRRGGRGTPKRCSHCHMPLKEGHKEDCVAWERKIKMRKLAEGIESGQITTIPVAQATGMGDVGVVGGQPSVQQAQQGTVVGIAASQPGGAAEGGQSASLSTGIVTNTGIQQGVVAVNGQRASDEDLSEDDEGDGMATEQATTA